MKRHIGVYMASCQTSGHQSHNAKMQLTRVLMKGEHLPSVFLFTPNIKVVYVNCPARRPKGWKFRTKFDSVYEAVK